MITVQRLFLSDYVFSLTTFFKTVFKTVSNCILKNLTLNFFQKEIQG